MKPVSTITSVLLLSALVACVAPQPVDPFAPTPEMAKESGESIETLGQGYAIYMRQCSQCHERKIPTDIPTKEWHKITPGMTWNAGLSKEEKAQVTAYVIAASKLKITAPAAE